jgi:CDGSH-type Zn-finger protein
MRKVTKTDRAPLKIPPQEKAVWICMCGLSKNQPYCDGSHKSCSGEEEGKVYEYAADGARREVAG